MPIPKRNSGEKETDFIQRCMSDEKMKSEFDTEQRYAICVMQLKNVNLQSYSDYGLEIRNNAKRGIELNEKNGNKCATQTGKVRAQQLANGEPISIETIKRMYSYLSRAETYYDNADSQTDCGYISYLLWGGKSALSWSRNKLESLGLSYELDAQKISFDFDGTINTDKGLQMALEYKKKGSVVYIISARSDKQSMYPRANKAGVLFSRIFATGSNKAKIDKIRELGIDTHYDNNPDVIKELGSIGKLI